MTNRKWVTLLYFLARVSHQSCLITWPTVCEWHFFISLQGSLINHVSSHDQQDVSDTALFLYQAVLSIMSHPMTNRMWVTLLYFFARQSYQSCLIPWPTGSEWHCFISLPGSLINHVSSHDQQQVSDTAFFFSNYFTIPWPIEQVVSLMNFFNNQFYCPSSYNQQSVRDIPFLLVTSLHMISRSWVGH